jgi:predicted anti-sigma-YlaC factor YlaD
MICEEFREMLEPYLEERLEEGRRPWFRRHLRECPECRRWAVAEDPSLLFALAGEKEADPVRVEACAEAVTTQIRQQRLERRLGARRRPWLAAAAAITIAVGGGLVWRMNIGTGETPTAPAMEARREVEGRLAPPTVEVDMRGEDVRVYRFANDEDADTAVYFVVNPGMEL